MPYSQFTTLRKAITAFNLTLQERRFFPQAVQPIVPGEILKGYLELTLPAAATGSEKVRSEGIVFPVLVEVRRILDNQVSIFSGEDFTIDESIALNDVVDFLISRSPIVSTIEYPVLFITEAKKADLAAGYGQCVAEMVAAQKFNQVNGQTSETVYGCVSNGTQWRFLQLKGAVVTLDLTDYILPPVDQILGILVHLLSEESKNIDIG
jgi:hypothetical protein